MISVVIPLFNKANYIERALRSVLSQSCQDFEIVVVDDGSTDGSAECAAAMNDSRIKLLFQQNSGVSTARNKGIKLSESEVIAFLDADDEWDPWFLDTVIKMAQTYPDVGLFGTAYRYIISDGSVVYPDFPGLTDGIMSSFFHTPYIWTSAAAVRKSHIVNAGGFPVGVRCGEDLDTWIRIAIQSPVAWSTRCCSIYHNEASAVNNVKTLWVGDASFAELVMKSKEHIPQAQWNDLYELLCTQRLRIFAPGTYLAGHKKEARKMVWESRKTRREYKHFIFMLLIAHMPDILSNYILKSRFKMSGNCQFVEVGYDGHNTPGNCPDCNL